MWGENLSIISNITQTSYFTCFYSYTFSHNKRHEKSWFKNQNMIITPDYFKNILLNILGSFQKETELTLFPHIYHQITLILQNQRCTYSKRKDLSPLLNQSGIFYSHTVIYSSLFTKLFAFSALCLLLDSSPTNLEKAPSPQKLQPLTFDVLSSVALTDLWANLQAL